MSRLAKSVFALSLVTAVSVVVGVHWMQRREQLSMREGIARDEERRRQRQLNMADLDQQRELRARLELAQPINSH